MTLFLTHIQRNKIMAYGSLRIVDGFLDASGGIDSGKVTTIASQNYPNGLKRNQLAWLGNGTVRGGGISNRPGFQPLVQGAPWSGIYQGGFLHEPDAAFPHLILSIGGRIYQVRVDTDNSVVDLSTTFGLTNPPDVEQGFFEQGEMFTVIQAGDFVTNPLFWDGNILRRSNGITGVTTIGASNINELPPAGAMDYYQGRLWYSFGRLYCAGDIVKGPSGTAGAPYFQRDSILRVTESPVGAVGDGFVVPSNAGNIRGITHTAELDTSLGQGNLYIGTRKSIYRLQVPVTRTDWINTDNAFKQPFQTVCQVRYGFVNDRSLVRINGDLFYQTLEPGIRSLALAIRYFGEWSNTAISKNVNRVLRLNDRELLHAASGIEFNNRILQTCLPFRTAVGIAHKGILSLDLDVITSLEEKLPPAWEGMQEGLDVLQMFEGDFGGRQRAFAIMVSRLNGEIQVWEITEADRTDNGDNRISRFFETASYTWGDPFKLKQLETLELWFDKLYGTVEFEVYFRPDQHPCWIPWHAWKECAARDCSEDLEAVICPPYPRDPYCEQYRATKTLPKPPEQCLQTQKRGVNIGYQFQIKVVTKGTNRIRGMLLHALPVEKKPFEGLVCDNQLGSSSLSTTLAPVAFSPAPVPPVTVTADVSEIGDGQDDLDGEVQGSESAMSESASASDSQSSGLALDSNADEAGAADDSTDAAVVNLGEIVETESAADSGDATTEFSAAMSESASAADTLDGEIIVTAPLDTFEDYTNGDQLNGLNAGIDWLAAWVSHNGAPAPLDTFESYADTANLNGLNGGDDWAASWVSR